MKVVILNDCSAYHCGSAHVINLLKRLIKSSENEISGIIQRPTLQFGMSKVNNPVLNLIDKSDIIIVNGEGAFHDDNIIIENIGFLMKKAKEKGKKTILFNAVWQNNPKHKIYLQYFDKIYVREGCSQEEVKNDGFNANILPDITFLEEEIINSKEKDIAFGGDIMHPTLKDPIFEKCQNLPIVNIFNYKSKGFKKLIQDLSKYKVILSGRHHTFIACCKAGTKCIPIVGNSHKLKGILRDANSNIILIKSVKDYDKAINFINSPEAEIEYKKLFNYVNYFQIEDYKKIFK